MLDANPGNIREGIGVKVMDATTKVDMLLQHVHLTATDAGTHIAQAVVETDDFMVIIWHRFLSLSGILLYSVIVLL